jgi:hypothetical protein
MPKKSLACVMKCADGSPCGRRVTDGSLPPICHLHRAVAAGNPHNGGTTNPPRDLDPLDVLRRDLRASEASVRVRAATELLAEERRRRDERADHDAVDVAYQAFSAALTPEEKVALYELLLQVRFLKLKVYQRCPAARPAGFDWPPAIASDEHEPGTLFIRDGQILEAAPMPSASATNMTEEPEEDIDVAEEVEEEAEPFHIHQPPAD